MKNGQRRINGEGRGEKTGKTVMEKKRWWRTAAAFALLAAAAGALQWNWFSMPLERDEGEYAYAAWLMRTGKGVPYRDSFLQKPPMIVYTYGLVESLAPGSDKIGFRVAGFLAALAPAGLVWRLGKRDFGGRAGLWGAWLWVLFLQQLTMFNSVAANVEKF
ncbi:MAG: glycosyltransferase family 39 protein, partial [Kiritimatiellae bacterium]|nr:glycosyltransferase family 39 protein [Kiritimatiellia bacterium]